MHAGIIATPVAAPPDAVARQYFVGQALGAAQNSDHTTWSNQVSLTFAADNAREYVVFWMCELSMTTSGSPTGGEEVQLTVGAAQVTYARAHGGLDQWIAQGGMHHLVGAGADVTLTLDFRRVTDSFSSEVAWIRNARIVALRLESGDEWAESLPLDENTTGAFADALTLSFTPASTRSYLLLGHGVMSFATTPEVRIYDGAAGTEPLQLYLGGSTIIGTDDHAAIVHGWIRPGLSGAQTFHLQHRTVTHATGNPSDFTGARLLALDLSGFTHAYHAELSADTIGGAGAYADVLTLSRVIAADDYLVLSTYGTFRGGGQTGDLITRINDPTGGVNEQDEAARPIATCPAPGFVGTVGAYAAGSRTWALQSYGDGGVTPGSTIQGDAVIAVLKLN